EGKRREHQLGSILRKRYHHFLDNLYTPDIVDARCSDFSRTKMSLELVLAALFPPRGTLEQWLPGLNWQPVPYNFERVTSDKLFFGNMVCPNYKKSYEKYMNTEEGRALINKYSKIFYYLSENTGWNITDFVLVFLLYDTLKTEVFKEMASKEYWILSATTKMKQINSGHLLKKIIIDTLSKINGTLNQKLYLYSGHDFNIASLLIALGIFKQHIPPYGSCILIEVHCIRGQYGVKKGKQMEFRLGKALRRRYDKFLGKIYTPDILEAVSSDTNRTKMSIQLVLAGLFPPVKEQIWETGLNWQPIPYSALPRKQDKLLLGIYCPKFNNLYYDLITSPKMSKEFEQHTEIFHYLSKNSGMEVKTYWDVFFIYMCLKTEKDYGLELPEWTNKVFPKPMEDLSIKSYGLLTATTELKRLASGKMFLNHTFLHMDLILHLSYTKLTMLMDLKYAFKFTTNYSKSKDFFLRFIIKIMVRLSHSC
ncbi:His Phos 2 domain containing protein, partial [Asbolus verrucosus]